MLFTTEESLECSTEQQNAIFKTKSTQLYRVLHTGEIPLKLIYKLYENIRTYVNKKCIL